MRKRCLKFLKSVFKKPYLKYRIFKVLGYLSVGYQYQHGKSELKNDLLKLKELKDNPEADVMLFEIFRFKTFLLKVRQSLLYITLISYLVMETWLFLSPSLVGYGAHRILVGNNFGALLLESLVVAIYYFSSVCSILNICLFAELEQGWRLSTIFVLLFESLLLFSTVYGLTNSLAFLDYRVLEPGQFPAIKAKPTHRDRFLRSGSKGPKRIKSTTPLLIEYNKLRGGADRPTLSVVTVETVQQANKLVQSSGLHVRHYQKRLTVMVMAFSYLRKVQQQHLAIIQACGVILNFHLRAISISCFVYSIGYSLGQLTSSTKELQNPSNSLVLRKKKTLSLLFDLIMNVTILTLIGMVNYLPCETFSDQQTLKRWIIFTLIVHGIARMKVVGEQEWENIKTGNPKAMQRFFREYYKDFTKQIIHYAFIGMPIKQEKWLGSKPLPSQTWSSWIRKLL